MAGSWGVGLLVMRGMLGNAQRPRAWASSPVVVPVQVHAGASLESACEIMLGISCAARRGPGWKGPRALAFPSGSGCSDLPCLGPQRPQCCSERS